MFFSLILIIQLSQAHLDTLAQSWEKEFRDTLVSDWNDHVAGTQYWEYSYKKPRRVIRKSQRSYIRMSPDTVEMIAIPIYTIKHTECADSLYKMIQYNKDPRLQYSLLQSDGRFFYMEVYSPIQVYLDAFYDAHPLQYLEKRYKGWAVGEISEGFYQVVKSIRTSRPNMHVFRLYGLPDLWGLEENNLYFITDDQAGNLSIKNGQDVYLNWISRFGVDNITRLSDWTQFLDTPFYCFLMNSFDRRWKLGSVRGRIPNSFYFDDYYIVSDAFQYPPMFAVP